MAPGDARSRGSSERGCGGTYNTLWTEATADSMGVR